jgi:hypothetical protein
MFKMQVLLHGRLPGNPGWRDESFGSYVIASVLVRSPKTNVSVWRRLKLIKNLIARVCDSNGAQLDRVVVVVGVYVSLRTIRVENCSYGRKSMVKRRQYQSPTWANSDAGEIHIQAATCRSPQHHHDPTIIGRGVKVERFWRTERARYHSNAAQGEGMAVLVRERGLKYSGRGHERLIHLNPKGARLNDDRRDMF